jgi:flagellar hook-basal body complex protein FliE
VQISSVGGKFISQPLDVSETKSAEGGGFGESIKKALSSVNEQQNQADVLANGIAAGDAVEVHQAMIAMQKASLALQFTIQVRNKVVEAYQEIMRTQL